jgi:uncharacterized membrane protein YraQ (UPF0718 family)/copper chaperone CopZ
MRLLSEAWSVLLALAPWLLLGAALAGLLHVLVPPGFVRRRFRGYGGVVRAVALGVPLPLCSCGVIPAAIGLRRDGASRGAAIGFLVATPQTGVDSILVSASLLGWPFALWKVGSALVTGLVAGFLVEREDEDGAPAPEAATPETTAPRGLRAGIDHAVEVVRSIWRWIALGVAVSAVIGAWVPPASLAAVAELPAVLVMLATLAIAVPLYVCATASVPIAAMLVAGGFPPGAALVFLMAGPATNVATIGAVARGFGRRALVIYLSTIVIGSMALAWIFDAVLADTAAAHVHAHLHGEGAWWEVTAAVVLVAALGWFALADLRRWSARSRAAAPAVAVLPTIEVGVVGMNCEGCVAHLEDTLRGAPGVVGCEVTLEPGRAIVRGDIDEAAVHELVRKAGYSPARAPA